MSEEQAKKRGRGGKRLGAGRKPSPDRNLTDRIVVPVHPEIGEAYRDLCRSEGMTVAEDVRVYVEGRLRKAGRAKGAGERGAGG